MRGTRGCSRRPAARRRSRRSRWNSTPGELPVRRALELEDGARARTARRFQFTCSFSESCVGLNRHSIDSPLVTFTRTQRGGRAMAPSNDTLASSSSVRRDRRNERVKCRGPLDGPRWRAWRRPPEADRDGRRRGRAWPASSGTTRARRASSPATAGIVEVAASSAVGRTSGRHGHASRDLVDAPRADRARCPGAGCGSRRPRRGRRRRRPRWCR